MEQLPIYTSAAFIATTFLTVLILYRTSFRSKAFLVFIFTWLVLQACITSSGFYTVSRGVPPRFVLLLFPPIACIIVLFSLSKGRKFLDRFDTGLLTVLHIVRVPVELVLLSLFHHHAVPEVMTFDGRNFDILSGLTAPVIYFFAYRKSIFGRGVLIVWNVVCLLLLFNIVGTAVLSAPFRFQQFGYEQPNIALFYFPFSWLPCFIVPAVLLAHLICLRKLLCTKSSLAVNEVC